MNASTRLADATPPERRLGSEPQLHDDAARPTAQVIALAELPDPANDARDRLFAASNNPLHRVKVRLQVSVGEVSISIGELLEAHQHQVLVLDRQVEQPVDVLLEGKVVARGQLVAVDDSFAVRITEIPYALKP